MYPSVNPVTINRVAEPILEIENTPIQGEVIIDTTSTLEIQEENVTTHIFNAEVEICAKISATVKLERSQQLQPVILPQKITLQLSQQTADLEYCM